MFIAGHAWGWGPMPWLISSEVQPLHTRAAGTGFAVVINFLLTFLIGQASEADCGSALQAQQYAESRHTY